MTKKYEYSTIMGLMTNKTLDTEDFDSTVSEALNSGWELAGPQSLLVTKTDEGDSVFVHIQPVLKVTETEEN